MSNFWSNLGQGLTQFGHQRQQRQEYDREVARQEEERQQRQFERDRSYAWEVASNLAPDQELDDASFGALSKAGPEISAYVHQDPTTGKRLWRGTQQQRTSAARERAAQEAAERQNSILANQEAELQRREKLNRAVAEFTTKNGRRPSREELFGMMAQTETLDPKMVVDWDMDQARIKSAEALQQRYLAQANRDNRWVPSQPRQTNQPLDVQQLLSRARSAFAAGTMTAEEYQQSVQEINRIAQLQKNPLQFYMNDLQNDITSFGNASLQPGQPQKDFSAYRNPETMEQFLKYIQSDPTFQAQLEMDIQSPEDRQRYIAFVQQIRDKWQQEQANQPAQAPWYQFWR